MPAQNPIGRRSRNVRDFAVLLLACAALGVAAQEPSAPAPAGSAPPGTEAEPEGGPGAGFGALFGEGGAPLRVRLLWQPPADVKRQDTDLELFSEEVSANAPLWQAGGTTLRFTASGRLDRFDTGAMLPESGWAFPDELWTLRVGTGLFHRYANGWMAGGFVNLTSASDRPYGDLPDCSVGFFAFLRLPRPPRDAWNFGLMYAPLSETPYPLPGVSYLWWPVPEFRANLGLPFAVRYRPIPDLTLDASYMLVRTVRAQATYRLGGPWRVYAAYERTNQSWYLHERENDDERFFAYAQRGALGLQTTLFARLTLDLSGGVVFDRIFFNGEDYGDRYQDRVNLRNGPFMALQAGYKF